MTRDAPHDPPPTILIGPGFDGPGRERDEGAGCADPAQVQFRKLFLRIAVALVLMVALAVLCFVVMPMAAIPPWVPLAAFAIILVSVVINLASGGESAGGREGADGDRCDDGRPIGCCPGPRPPEFLRQPPKGR